MADLESTVAALQGDLIALRHDLHAHPEPGFEETRTQAAVRAALAELGLAPRDCARTGVVVDLGPGGGRTIALRADLDCLRMTEDNPDLPYRSAHSGLAHMCGHDGHTATLIGAARALAPVAERLGGTVRLLFQPAEEGPGGAPLMIEDGALDGVDEVYGMHNWPTMPLGALRTIAGPCMAHVCTFSVTITGTGGHASQPHAAQDTVLAAAHVVTALQSIVARNVGSAERAVVSITMIHGGEVHNVIPSGVKLTGSIRVLDDSVYDLIEDRIAEIATGVAQGLGTRADCEFDRMYPVVLNSQTETEHVCRVGRQVFGEANVSSESLPMLGGEDFAYYLKQVPGCFFFLGGGEPGRGNSMCHATTFDYNDHLIAPGVRFWVRLVEDRLATHLYD